MFLKFITFILSLWNIWSLLGSARMCILDLCYYSSLFISSAGIGRTGVLITMETAMCLVEANQTVFPLAIVRQMRDQRAMLIQTAVSKVLQTFVKNLFLH